MKSRSAEPAIVLGTRPEIIKMSPVLRAFERMGRPALIIHTNQHYSANLDRIFFEELELPPPVVNLDVGSATQGVQTGRMLQRLEPVLEQHRPGVVLVEGDTNSVLAGALAAVKLGIPVGHVEAGLRSRDRSMPEELNRIATNHVADHLYAPTDEAVDILRSEGLPESRILLTGNTVVDACLEHMELARPQEVLERHGLKERSYLVVTSHRKENTDDPERLRGLVEGLMRASESLGMPLVFPVHPRTLAALRRHGVDMLLRSTPGIRLLEPVGYLDFLALLGQAALALSDSGGVQEEACVLGVPCVTLRDNTERPESVAVGANRLAGTDPERIADAALEAHGSSRNWTQPFGDGRAGARIAEHVMTYL